MVDRSGLRLVGFIFASVTLAVMLTTTMARARCKSTPRAGSAAAMPDEQKAETTERVSS